MGESMFVFEVAVENIVSYVLARELQVKAEFADIFDMDITDPDRLNVEIPEPPPLPPPTGKKGKKAKKAKKPKGKKGKKEKIPPPPPKPIIQSGQSVLFPANIDFLESTMNEYPLNLSLWTKDGMESVGSTIIKWSKEFYDFLGKLRDCDSPDPPPVAVKDDYNTFEETSAKRMATIRLQVKLTHLKEQLVCQFRSLHHPDERSSKSLYTMPSLFKTAFSCKLMKTSKEQLEQNQAVNKYQFVREKPATEARVFANYKNAPTTTTLSFRDPEFCCRGRRDPPPGSLYSAPSNFPSFDTISDYVNKLITECNECLRTLVPKQAIQPRVRATDMDKTCYCHPEEQDWPKSDLADAMRYNKKYKQTCIPCKYAEVDDTPTTFEISSIRGPCGRTDCKVAKTLKSYIQNLANEDNQEIEIDSIVGPCGSTTCKFASQVKKFIRGESTLSGRTAEEGLNTICGCHRTMKALLGVPDKPCFTEANSSESDEEEEREKCVCDAKTCPTKYFEDKYREYTVGFCFVTYDIDNIDEDNDYDGENDCEEVIPIDCEADISDKCGETCKYEVITVDEQAPYYENIEIGLDEITSPCGKPDCKVADHVRNIIKDGMMNAKPPVPYSEPCYCDCKCTFTYGRKTTFCTLCGGYEEPGDDIKYLKDHDFPPLPCPIYHKLVDKSQYLINEPGSSQPQQQPKAVSRGDQKAVPKAAKKEIEKQSLSDGELETEDNIITKKKQKSKSKFETEEDESEGTQKHIKRSDSKKKGMYTMIDEPPRPRAQSDHGLPAKRKKVPKNMGWMWDAKDIPGLEYRPDWKPGAITHEMNAKYKLAKGISIKKKDKGLTVTSARKGKDDVEIKPALVITKKDGEYTVRMEVMKPYDANRQPFEYPFEKKEPLFYKIGRTEHDKERREKLKAIREKKQTRAKKRYIESTFRNMCDGMCKRRYEEAIGILPKPNPNEPVCSCGGPIQQRDSELSCSCGESELGSLASSETDNDEWIVEFTPPHSKYNPNLKPLPPKESTASQYNYLDFRVELFDKHNDPVPRFFIGPDGKTECSDLGGFYSPEGKWLVIGEDGFVAKDGRWCPMQFIGPDGMKINAEDGFFDDPQGNKIVIGVDGYVNSQGNWVYLNPPRKERKQGNLKLKALESNVSTWTCLGSAPLDQIVQRNFLPHTADKKRLKERLDSLGMIDKMPKGKSVPRFSERSEKATTGTSDKKSKAK